uniref:MFS domain-containing protein n=1 Tax=Macrostomum lignano TaxID=282301 RepID=A0A1I8I3H7_9PLAT
MSKRDIEFLFVAGFGASMLFGTIVGSIADKYGRRKNCIIYGIVYGLTCITKHFNNFWVLLIGRLLGGTATSILWSGFESWLVHEHHSRGYSEHQLEETFNLAIFFNSIGAIASGLVSQYAVDWFGFVAPFDCALLVLLAMAAIAWLRWPENYGDSGAQLGANFAAAWNAVRTDRKVLSLGITQAMFEGSMYCFVLEWTPALTPEKLSELRLRCRVKTDALIPATFGGFLAFEACIGLFWPAIGTMRGRYVPDATRATVMNFFRVPLNLIVVVILTQNFPLALIFKCCTGFMFIAFVTQVYLNRITKCQDLLHLNELQKQQQQEQEEWRTSVLDSPAESESAEQESEKYSSPELAA